MGSLLTKFDVPGPSEPPDRKFGATKTQLIPWDISEEPVDNSDRDKKLGSFDATHAAAAIEFDDKFEKLRLGDGHTNKSKGRPVTSRLFEPDCWVLRLHTVKGKEKDGVWATRLIADHSNKHNEREMRSTILIDQRKEQKWGTLAEILWVKDVGATFTQDELDFNAAGFLRSIAEDNGVATGPRLKYHTTWNYYKKAGYVTDGENIQQMKHLWTFANFSKSVPTGNVVKFYDQPCDPIPPDIEKESVDGKVVNADGDKFGELSMWADHLFKQEEGVGTTKTQTQPGGVGSTVTSVTKTAKTPAHLGPLGLDPIVDECPLGELRFGGFLWSRRKQGFKWDRKFSDPTNPNGKKEFDLEDSPEFGKKTRLEWIRIWIRTPRL